MSDRHPADDCVHCGFCLPVCPTYLAWGEEMDSPRGRIDLVRALRSGAIPPSSEAVRHLDRCLGCMACLAACPSGVRYDRVIEEARGLVERTAPRTRLERVRRRLLFWLLPYPPRLRVAAFFLWLYRVTGLRLLVRSLGLLRLSPLLRQMDGLAPELRFRDVGAALPLFTAAEGERRGRVALVTGCVQRVFFPGVNEATVRVLAAEGFEVAVPPRQGCCGALSMHTGRLEEARRFARALVEALDGTGADFVLVNAAGCGSHLKDLSLLFGGDPFAERAAAFSRRVRDVTEFLAAQPPRGQRHPLPGKVAYHSPCHLGHAQKIQEAPRALLRAIPGLELVEVPEPDQCCGSAGVYNLLEVEAANEIGARKARNILATGAPYLASANPGCTLHVKRLLREQGVTLEAAHPIEILDASLRGKPLPRRGG